MNVYAKYKKTQDFLKKQKIEGINIVDNPKYCHYMITGRYTKADYNPNLKGVIIPYTGHNGINLDDMRLDNLKLFVTPIRTRYVSEKAVTLTLSLLGKTVYYHNLLKQGNWAERNNQNRVPWVSIQDKVIGLYGYGRIGRITHKMLKGFGCECYTINRQKDYDGIKLVNNLEELIKVSDIIIIAVPLNTETIDTFNEKVLKKMKNKYLVNVGRGKIVNQQALYNSLKDKELAGYASDVWFNYPKNDETCYPSDYPIHELDNVVMSNHSGGFTDQTNDEVNEALVKQLIKLREDDTSDALDLSSLI